MTVFDLINDEQFIQWIIAPTEELDLYWATWATAHPQYAPLIQDAKAIVLKMHEAQKEDVATLDEMSSATWNQIINTLDNRAQKSKKRRSNFLWWSAAAVLLLSLSITWFRLQLQKPINPILSNEEGYVIKSNLSKTPMLVFLPDGSKVSLEPGASLKSKILLNDSIREVYLQGNAFFQVANDSSRAFIVHTDYMNTRVLGTSFWILTGTDKQQQTVAVKTGKVAVASVNNLEDVQVLLPNEQLTYNNHEQLLTKTVADPEIIKKVPSIPRIAIEFNDIDVPTILDSLSSAYGIEIIYDPIAFERCRVTTALSSESLYEKLNILCKATGANVRSQDNKLYISGGNCR